MAGNFGNRRPHHNSRKPEVDLKAQAAVRQVQQIIEVADRERAELLRLAAKAENLRRTIWVLIKAAGGEVRVEKAMANLLNGTDGLAKRFQVIGDSPEFPDHVVYRLLEDTGDTLPLDSEQAKEAKRAILGDLHSQLQNKLVPLGAKSWWRMMGEIQLVLNNEDPGTGLDVDGYIIEAQNAMRYF